MMGLAGAIQQLNIVTTRLKHDPSIGGSHYALQIASLLAQRHNNMRMMADDGDDIHADRTCNNNKQPKMMHKTYQRWCFVASKADMESPS